MRITLLLAFITLAGASLHASAGDVYRWVDEKGVAHYSDTPPANGKFERVNVRTGGGTTVPAANADADTTTDATADEKAKTDPAVARAERCKAARASLSALRSNMEVSIEENGKPRALTEDERLEYADRNERVIALDCDTP